MKAETRLARIMALPDDVHKLYMLWEFAAFYALPYSPLWKTADAEILRLSVKGVKYYNGPEKD